MSFGLHNLQAPRGARTKRRRVGRGESSGMGKTCGGGGKGQTVRTGKGKPRRGFEGGQMPMYRRLPKHGFVSLKGKTEVAFNLDFLAKMFTDGGVIDLEALKKGKFIGNQIKHLRILGRGELTKPLEIVADHFSSGAKEKIIAAGGEARLVSVVAE